MEQQDLRSFSRELTALVLPIALQALLSALVSASDAFMLGFLDQSSLSAISLATQVSFVLSLFHAAFAIGSAVLSAQYWGIRDTDTLEKVLGISLRFSMPVSALFFLWSLLGSRSVMGLFTSDPELIRRGGEYLRIVSVSYLTSGFSQMFLNTMKNSGRVARSSVYASAAVIVNIALNLALIFGLLGAPRLGIRGAAIATVIARGIELLLCLLENLRPGQVRLRPACLFRGERELGRRYRSCTAPVLANEIAWGGGVTMFSVILGHMGSDAVAANAVVNILKNILLCFCTGIGTGSAIMVGNRLGAGDLEGAKTAGRRLLAASILFGALAGGCLLAAAPWAGRAVGALTPRARVYVRQMGLISSVYVIGKSFNSTLIGGIFTAGGDTGFGFWCDLINMWAFIIPLASLAAFVLGRGVMTVYLILSLDEFGKLPFEIIHYKKYKWVKNLTKEEDA